MGLSITWYMKEFARFAWLRTFLFAKTAPLTTPSYHRGYPVLTGNQCTHQLFCMMACPAPGAIEVVHAGRSRPSARTRPWRNGSRPGRSEAARA